MIFGEGESGIKEESLRRLKIEGVVENLQSKAVHAYLRVRPRAILYIFLRCLRTRNTTRRLSSACSPLVDWHFVNGMAVSMRLQWNGGHTSGGRLQTLRSI